MIENLELVVDPINNYVQEAMKGPAERLDLWQETVCAVFFSYSWEIFSMIASLEKLEYEEFKENCFEFIEALSIKAAPWIQERFAASVPKSINIDFGTVCQTTTQQRINFYFLTAGQGMADRDLDIEQARAFSCKFCFDNFLNALPVKRSLNPFKPSPTKNLQNYANHALKYCEQTAKESHDWITKMLSDD